MIHYKYYLQYRNSWVILLFVLQAFITSRDAIATNTTDYDTAFTKFISLVLQAKKNQKMPELNNKETADLLGILTNSKWITDTKNTPLFNRSALANICNKANMLSHAYITLNVKTLMKFKNDRATLLARLKLLIKENTKKYQDELALLQPFTLRCMSVHLSQLSKSLSSIKLDKMDPAITHNIKIVQRNTFKIYSDLIAGLVDTPGLKQTYRHKLTESLSETATKFSRIMSLTSRKHILNLAKTIKLTSKPILHKDLDKIMSAMKNTDCNAICAL